MNPHMIRRMEVLAKKIAAAKAPKIDAAANAIFDQIGKRHDGMTNADWSKKKDEAKVRTVEDVCDEPTDAERDYIMNLRGGCRCSWPTSSPPCNVCTDEYTEDEATEALEETAQ